MHISYGYGLFTGGLGAHDGEAALKPAELGLAKQIIQQIASETFAPEKYKDDVQARMRDLIDKKIAGQEITVHWQRSPWIVRHRTREEVGRAVATNVDMLRDTLARSGSMPEKAPATDENRRDPGHPDWIVVSAVCSRDSVFLKPAFDTDRTSRGEAWWCPVCASRYDAAGRVIAGPAPANLAVPRYVFISPIRLEIGG